MRYLRMPGSNRGWGGDFPSLPDPISPDAMGSRDAGANYCGSGQVPQLGFGFADLNAQLGDVMGDAME
jgi:hypothetical protein